MIWVVTDDERTSSTLFLLITGEGYRVRLNACHDDFGQRVRFQTPKLIVVDCGVSDGLQILADVRERLHGHPIPVIVFGEPAAGRDETLRLKGAAAFVAKGPLDWHDLRAEIHRHAGPPGGPPEGAI